MNIDDKVRELIKKYEHQFDVYNALSEDETNNIATHYFMIIGDLKDILKEAGK